MCTVQSEEETKRGQAGHHLERNVFRERKSKNDRRNVWSNTCHSGINPINVLCKNVSLLQKSPVHISPEG